MITQILREITQMSFLRKPARLRRSGGQESRKWIAAFPAFAGTAMTGVLICVIGFLICVIRVKKLRK